jgi:hypothetical protein
MEKIDLPEPTYIPGVPYLEIGSDGTEIVKHIDYPITQPHAMFSDLHDKYPRQFETLLGDGPEKFWENVKEDDPKLHKHPVLEQKDFKKKAVPISIFFDHAPFTKNASMTLCLWRLLLSPMYGGWDSIFLACAFPKQLACKYKKHGCDTWDLILQYLAWSFWHLLWGWFPRNDPFGQLWGRLSQNFKRAGDLIAQGKYIGALWLLCVDKDYLCNDLQWPHYNAMECALCDCSLDPRDSALHAAWKSTLIPKDSFRRGGNPD